MNTNQPLPTRAHRTILALGCAIALLATLLLVTALVRATGKNAISVTLTSTVVQGALD